MILERKRQMREGHSFSYSERAFARFQPERAVFELELIVEGA